MEQHDLPQAQTPQPNNARVFVILGWVFAGLSILFNFFTGVPGIIMGIIAIAKGSKKQGIWIIVISIVLTIFSLVVSALLIAWASKYMPMNPNMQP